MSEDISDKVRALLEDPEMVAKIAMIAGGLGGGKTAAPAASPEPPVNPARDIPTTDRTLPAEHNAVYESGNAAPVIAKPPEAAKPAVVNDPRLSLLNSLKPFLREERRSKIDNLARALSVASLMSNFNKDKK